MLRKGLILAIFIIIVSFGITPSISAQQYSSDPLSVIVIYATENESCSPEEIKQMELFKESTKQYFFKHQPGMKKEISSFCIQLTEIDTQMYPFLLQNLGINRPDLMIFVGNLNVNLKLIFEEHASGVWACMVFSNDFADCKSSIVTVCDCPNLYIANRIEGAIWTLSHELSHFLLQFQNYSPKLYSDGVHNLQRAYDFCITNDSFDKCNGMYYQQSISGQIYNVMNIGHIKNNWKSLQSFEFDSQFVITPKRFPTTEIGKSESLKFQEIINEKIQVVKLGVLASEESLYSFSFDNSKVNEAWTALWWAKKHLGDAEYFQKEGENNVMQSKFEDAIKKYQNSWDSTIELEKKLFDLTALLNEAQTLDNEHKEKEVNKTCFLFWCW